MIGGGTLVLPEARADRVAAELRRRFINLDAIEQGLIPPAFLFGHYRTHLVDWVNDWGVTIDQREEPAFMPFLIFRRQREFLEWLATQIAAGHECLVEKSRDFGASWLCCAYAVHSWLFRRDDKITFGANKAENVDVLGNPDSLLERVRTLIRALPPWMRPAGWERVSGYMKIVNPQNGSVITGATGDNMARGGRARAFFIDEAAHLQHAELANAATAAVAQSRVWVSSVYGTGGLFAKKRFSLPEDRVFVMDWRDDPRKDEAWARQKQADLDDPVAWAREYERDYSASVERVAIPAAWVAAAVELWQRERAALEDCAKRFPAICGLDVGGGGTGKTVHVVRRGPVVEPPVGWTGGDTTADAYRALELTQRAGGTVLFFDAPGVGLGVSSTLRRVPEIRSIGVNTGQPASYRTWGDTRRARDVFANLKAELWWTMRERFLRAWEYLRFVDGHPDGVQHDLADCLALPREAQRLVVQLSQPQSERTQHNKIAIEQKASLDRRGVPSPDHADALALTFAQDEGEISVRPVVW